MVAFGGALGSMLRYSISLVHIPFALHTLLANIIGSFLLGVFASRLEGGSSLSLFLTVGFCGGLTTFSTFALDLFKALQEGNFGFMVLYALGSVLLSVVCIGLGYHLK